MNEDEARARYEKLCSIAEPTEEELLEAMASFQTSGQDCYEMGRAYYPNLPPWKSLNKQESAEWEQIAQDVENIVNS